MINIRNELFLLKDDKYKNFQGKLLPGINNFIGVRVPVVRKLSTSISYEEKINYIENYNCEFLEEYLLKGLFISDICDINLVIKYTKQFIKQIDNWEVCDIFASSLKIVKENKKIFLDFINNYFNSNKEYEKRFVFVILLNYYINDEYVDKIFEIICKVKCSYYYDKMALAWLISYLYINYKNKTLYFFKHCNIDSDIYNMSIKKIIESNKVCKSDKYILNKLKSVQK